MALSDRMRGTVESVMPKIIIQVTQRSSINPPIDFGTAENWLIRKELVDFFKQSIAEELVEQVGSKYNSFYTEYGKPNTSHRIYHTRRASLATHE